MRPRLVLLGVLAMHGCAGTPSVQHSADQSANQTVALELLHSTSHCGIAEQRVLWIADRAMWQREYAQVMRLSMQPAVAPAVDFNRVGVLLISSGSQRSGGYGLSLAGAAATLQGNVLNVPVIWRTPTAGYRQAQVMSSSCLLLQIPQLDFTAIHVVDQKQQVLLEGKR